MFLFTFLKHLKETWLHSETFNPQVKNKNEEFSENFNFHFVGQCKLSGSFVYWRFGLSFP